MIIIFLFGVFVFISSVVSRIVRQYSKENIVSLFTVGMHFNTILLICFFEALIRGQKSTRFYGVITYNMVY
jgi:hypothetical protein